MCNEVSDVSIDGTFKCCAKSFLQMYNVHGLCNEHYLFVPLVSMLLPGKSESIYRRMWSAIRSFCDIRNLTLGPTNVQIEFEVAMHIVLKNAQCTFKSEL